MHRIDACQITETHIPGNTDDLIVGELPVEFLIELEMFAKRILSRPEVAGGRLADDRDMCTNCCLERSETTPADERDSESGEVGINGGISLGGNNSNQFTQTNNCPLTLAAGASCTVSVRFAPNQKGAKTATLNVNVAAPTVSQQVALTGTSL